MEMTGAFVGVHVLGDLHPSQTAQAFLRHDALGFSDPPNGLRQKLTGGFRVAEATAAFQKKSKPAAPRVQVCAHPVAAFR